MLEEDDGVDSPRVLPPDEADLVPASDAATAEGDLTADERPSDDSKESADETAAGEDMDTRLDEALKATFPASDPFDVLRAD
jgi:hypothetical protein